MGRLFAKYLKPSFIEETPSGTINGSNTAFILSQTPASPNAVQLSLDGLVLVQGSQYTLTGLNITMAVAPTLGQNLYAEYMKGR